MDQHYYIIIQFDISHNKTCWSNTLDMYSILPLLLIVDYRADIEQMLWDYGYD